MIIQNLDAWDRREFNDSIDNDYDTQSVEKQGSNKVHNFAEFMRDIFGGLYKYNPQPRDIKSAPVHEQWADKIYNEISQLQEWRDLRERTKMNPEAATAATVKFCKEFMSAVPQQADNKNKHNKTIANKDDAELEMSIDNDMSINPDSIDMSKVRRVARAACGEAAQEADAINEAIQAFGYGAGSGRPQFASPTQKKEVAARLRDNDHIKRIAELAGRMRRIASEKQKQKTKHGVDELADIKMGDDLARLIPAEICKLSHPLLKRDFQKRYLERQLLQYELRGKERVGRGPLIVCIDESGSMSGQRDIWAKAVAMALLQIAMQQKRKYAMIHFSAKVGRVDEFDNKTSPTNIIDAIAHFIGGGTDFMHPLNKAVELIKQDEYNKADIIFITDDNCAVLDKWLSEFLLNKQNYKFNVISVAISARADVCERFSDQVFYINQLTEADDALHSMFTV